jgi:hypothetical protein
MDIDLPTARLSFRVHFIGIHGSEGEPTVRILLVESTKAQPVYEGFGSFLQCKCWIAQLSGYSILGNQLVSVWKSLELKRLATIKEIWTSLSDLDYVGFQRVDR